MEAAALGTPMQKTEDDGCSGKKQGRLRAKGKCEAEMGKPPKAPTVLVLWEDVKQLQQNDPTPKRET